MKKILTLTLSLLFAITLTSCQPEVQGELTTFNPAGKITLLSLVEQMTPKDVMEICKIKKGDKRATYLYDPQLTCLRDLADQGNIIPMFTVANTDMAIYNKTKNPNALQEAVLYLKVIVAFSKLPEFDFNNISQQDKLIHKYNLQKLIRIVNVASQLLFKNKNANQAQLLNLDIKELKRHILITKTPTNIPQS